MPIKIKIDPDISAEDAAAATKPTPDAIISLEVRKTLDGKIMILDHMHMDIILDPVQKKITVFPKNELSDEVYSYQSSYFKFLTNEGIILPETVQSGHVFGSLEGVYPDAIQEGVDSAQVILYSTKQFIDKNSPALEAQEFIENEFDDYLIDPTPEDSTRLGEVPQEPKKGSITPYRIRRYLSGYGYY
jgi:arabinogalactan endo-1,4-beta-galactosidase